MYTKLSQKQIGRRLTELRKRKGLSQEDLAKCIKISRPSLAQIELGNRSVDILEMQDLSMVLEFSLDYFMSNEFSVSMDVEDNEKKRDRKITERVSEPSLQLSKFKNVFLYILERCAGKPNVGETVIYKLLYFSDFNYYELYEEHLTGATYSKLPFGPFPLGIDAIINQMVHTQQLQKVKTKYHGYPHTRFLPLEKADLVELKASEKEIIDRVIEQMSDWSAPAISNYAHSDMPWMATREGEEINYEFAFYRSAPYSVRNYGEEMEAK
jgi:transcriptional regulator with XRE-family HTH domain